MAEDQFFRPRNWDKFQKYDPKRNPTGTLPWFKVHTRILHDPDWLRLTCTQRAMMLQLWAHYAASGRPLGCKGAADMRHVGDICATDVRTVRRNLDALFNSKFIELCPEDARAMSTSSAQNADTMSSQTLVRSREEVEPPLESPPQGGQPPPLNLPEELELDNPPPDLPPDHPPPGGNGEDKQEAEADFDLDKMLKQAAAEDLANMEAATRRRQR